MFVHKPPRTKSYQSWGDADHLVGMRTGMVGKELKRQARVVTGGALRLDGVQQGLHARPLLRSPPLWICGSQDEEKGLGQT